jgi:predicted phosphoribosyltransferase
VRRQAPRELIAAAGVMPAEVMDRLAHEADRVVCLHAPQWFGAVGEFFEDFGQVEDDEVIAALTAPRRPEPEAPP